MPRDSSEVEGQDGSGVQTQTAWPQAGALTRRSARTRLFMVTLKENVNSVYRIFTK